MQLESFRHDPVGLPIFALKHRPEATSVQATYIDYAFRAFYLTMQDIEELEFAKRNLVPDGRNSIVAVTLWFLALESYINTLLKLTCFKVNKDFDYYKPKKLTEKFSSLLELLKIDSVPIKKAGTYNRIHEFTTFRNEVFHDRNIGQHVQFNKTKFSEIPVNCNLVDVLQGMLIFLEVSALMRYSISGLDTMPDILIHVNNKAFYKKLDFLHQSLIRPSFQQVLLKHNLETGLDLGFECLLPVKSNVFTGDATALIVSDSPSQYYYQLNPMETRICSELLLKIVNAENISPQQFGLGKYIVAENK